MTDPLIAHVYLDTCSGQRFVRDAKIERPTLHEYLGEVEINDPDITAPQPVLPSEPGVYEDSEGQPYLLSTEGTWSKPQHFVAEHLPLTRLVPERPQITREQVNTCAETSRNWDGTVDNILALVNGTDRD